MPKLVINNWYGGINQDKNSNPPGTMAEALDIDVYLNRGLLGPGYYQAVYGITDGSTPTAPIGGLLVDAEILSGSVKAYLLNQNGSLFEITDIAIPIIFTHTFEGGAGYSAKGTYTTKGYNLQNYNISGVSKMFVSYYNSLTGFSEIGYLNGTAITPLITGLINSAGECNYSNNVEMIEWQSNLYYANGRYVGKYRGSIPDNVSNKYDLGSGWEATKFFPTDNYLAICCWKKQASSGYRTESKIIYWDGSSSQASKITPIEDNKILNAINKDGVPYLITEGRDRSPILRVLNEQGAPKLKSSTIDVSGLASNFSFPDTTNNIDIHRNRIIYGLSGQVGSGGVYRNVLFSYGKENEEQPNALTTPISPRGTITTSGNKFGFVKTMNTNFVWASWTDGATSYFGSLSSGDRSTYAYYKGNYIDMGQKVRINYVKFYFAPLVSGDDITISLDTDYGTSNSLGSISFASDGAITKKKFKKLIDCHAFRPVIDWETVSSVNTSIRDILGFSKIVIDYSFSPEDL